MWILPTYNRPEKFNKFLAAAKETCVSTPGVILLAGDETGYDFTDLPPDWTVERIENKGLVKNLNEFYERHPDESWYGTCADDHVPVTKGWDVALIDAAIKRGFATCNDLDQAPTRMATACVHRGDVIRAAGFILPPCTFHTFGDDFWEKIGRDYGCWTVLMDVVIRHEHPFADASKKDATHELSYSHFDEDRKNYQAWYFSDAGRDAVARVSQAVGAKQRKVDLGGKSIAFGTPAYGGKFDATYVKSMAYTAALMEQMAIPFWTIYVGNDSLIHKARNGIVRSFLNETEATHLLFADADMGWAPEHVLRLLSHGKEVVAAAGMRKEESPSFCFRAIQDGEVCQETGCWEVESVGTGFMLIERGVLIRMIERFPELAYSDAQDKVIHSLFYNEIRGGKDWSEDYVFCRRCREMGIKIWIDPTVGLDHVGQKTWNGSVARESLIKRAERV